VILRDQNRNVFLSTGLCLGLCALLFATIFACKFLGDYDYLSPALAAWLPVLLFAPAAFVMLAQHRRLRRRARSIRGMYC
jgi:lipopolysaccharide export system permease protein